jgi:prevent-host-death family protein
MEATLREVQDHLPEYIARAQAGGEALTITDNGRPVARLVPLPKTPEELEQEALERLRAMPWIRPGNGEKPSFEPLLRIESGEKTAAEMVGEMRG